MYNCSIMEPFSAASFTFQHVPAAMAILEEVLDPRYVMDIRKKPIVPFSVTVQEMLRSAFQLLNTYYVNETAQESLENILGRRFIFLRQEYIGHHPEKFHNLLKTREFRSVSDIFRHVAALPLVRWDSMMRGGGSRAYFAYLQLVAVGFPKENMSRIIITPPMNRTKELVLGQADKSGVIFWMYHIALLVSWEGTDWVVDPAVAKMALLVHEWAHLCILNPEKYGIDGNDLDKEFLHEEKISLRRLRPNEHYVYQNKTEEGVILHREKAFSTPSFIDVVRKIMKWSDEAAAAPVQKSYFDG